MLNASRLSGLRVLVVDDDCDSCEWIGYALALYGMEVHTTYSVEQAIAAFQRFCFDVVLSDIAMPGEDGFALLNQIQQLQTLLEAVPIIAMTAWADRGKQLQGLQAGFADWLLKPIDLDELIHTIAQLTGRMEIIC
ncbi:response regulator [Phormidium tenue FACHB-886]|nr:response regulator [Phormidium tenue FACHB-886]